ncbi:hypothetical protein K2173_027740 [Erythroxylum novogranatense]|uniref:Peptidase A1 domain-containing protein n=1 Tax=Erythroxylum novogranatense TaxID=1862640 RepID=A0AAV8U3T3_9ROSI|nr:hypothetical protein K2173_027740 [Erythroxylum novogranatense]
MTITCRFPLSFIVSIILISPSVFVSAARYPLPLSIPLGLSSPNASLPRRTVYYRRRGLPNSNRPESQVALDDDNVGGYFAAEVYIGTPPQKSFLLVDTGSALTHLPCSGCKQCGKHQDPLFQPKSSSTFRNTSCNSRKLCRFARHYLEQSSSSGFLVDDVISFGGGSEFERQRIVFGCAEQETGEIYSQRADGIMGLRADRLSIVDQLVDQGVISNSFSLCFGSSGGVMILGSVSPPRDMVFSHSDPFRRYLMGQGTVIDSGSTFTYIPERAFHALKDAIIKKTPSVKQIPGPDPRYNDVCFIRAEREVSESELPKNFPSLDLVFGDSQKFTLSPENYLFPHTTVSGAYCLGIFSNGNDATSFLGGFIFLDTLVTYDRENKTIGFRKTNCSELSKILPSSSVSSPLPVVLPTVCQFFKGKWDDDYALSSNHPIHPTALISLKHKWYRRSLMILSNVLPLRTHKALSLSSGFISFSITEKEGGGQCLVDRALKGKQKHTTGKQVQGRKTMFG